MYKLKSSHYYFLQDKCIKAQSFILQLGSLLKYWRVNIYSYTSDDNKSWYIDFANTHTHRVGQGSEQDTYSKIVKIEVPGLSNTKPEVFS